MSGNDYLEALLESQRLDESSEEWAQLDAEAVKIEAILREAFPNSRLTFTHGGSRAKRTMIREDYDLDEVAYFEHDATEPGATLKEIYDSVASVLSEHYTVRRKRSALRLRTKDGKTLWIDVVPGRYVDNTFTDVFIHQNEGDKERLKTNIETHIRHVRDSGCTDIIMLGKLWRTRNGLRRDLKTFPLELMVIEVLSADNSGDTEDRFERVLTAFADDIDSISIEDPANPTGNDLNQALSDNLRKRMAKIARDTVDTAHEYGWEHVFGPLGDKNAALPRVEVLRSSAAAATVATQPWAK